MISWGPSVRPLHETAEHGGRSGAEDRGFLVTLDGIVPLEQGEQGAEGLDAGTEQDRLEF